MSAFRFASRILIGGRQESNGVRVAVSGVIVAASAGVRYFKVAGTCPLFRRPAGRR